VGPKTPFVATDRGSVSSGLRVGRGFLSAQGSFDFVFGECSLTLLFVMEEMRRRRSWVNALVSDLFKFRTVVLCIVYVICDVCAVNFD
jgi:hypothetical protein